jgi:hypothetical protein
LTPFNPPGGRERQLGNMKRKKKKGKKEKRNPTESVFAVPAKDMERDGKLWSGLGRLDY